MANEVGLADAFAHFFPGEEVNVDFAEKGSRNFMVVVDILTGFMQVYETKDKTSMTAVKVLREWSASFGRPYRVRCDSGPGYRQTFIEEMGKLGVQVIHSSAYNPSSNSHAERAVRTLKDILKKHENINSLQLKEILFCSNTRLQVNGAGSPLARFLGRDVLSGLPNSLDRSLNWDHLMQIRADEHQKRVNRPGRSSKQQFQMGEKVWVQNCLNKRWDRQGEISEIRTANDSTIVSYELLIGGVKAIRHRKFLRKVAIPHDADRRVFSDNEQSNDQGRQLGPGELGQPAEPDTVKPRRSERLKDKLCL